MAGVLKWVIVLQTLDLSEYEVQWSRETPKLDDPFYSSAYMNRQVDHIVYSKIKLKLLMFSAWPSRLFIICVPEHRN